ncbi:MAG: RluA family pseudouridine synthase, partial [Candidatus Staskawiczbacteria bacterium]|nr:RluA family pseudouridine synthase [Candidatus Staskawiczbacteria bacterium]
ENMIKVLYEDNHIIAVYKLNGVLTQGDRSGEPSLMDDVKKYLKDKYKKPGNVFLGLVHRLDKPVSGIVLFGKTSKGASRLSEQFRNHTIQKTYHAIVLGKPKEGRGELKEKINKISFFAEGFTNKTDEELLKEIKKATKTRTAELSWEVVKSNGKYSLIKILPKTGRFHQIRVQMLGLGHPILGDTKYPSSGQVVNAWSDRNSIALCASAISFKLATHSAGSGQAEDKTINLEIPLPEDWKRYL